MATSDNSGFGGKSATQPFGSTRAPVLPVQPPRAAETLRAGIERPPAAQAAEHVATFSARPSETEHRTLIVGREIGLSGEITSCDRLVVEGSVQANLANCRYIDIAESGLYKGSASIDDAEIRGRFEGTLIARKRLHIRSTGKVAGTVSYAQIEIEAGGQLSGEVQVLSDAAAAGIGSVLAAPPPLAAAAGNKPGSSAGSAPPNGPASAIAGIAPAGDSAGAAPPRVTR